MRQTKQYSTNYPKVAERENVASHTVINYSDVLAVPMEKRATSAHHVANAIRQNDYANFKLMLINHAKKMNNCTAGKSFKIKCLKLEVTKNEIITLSCIVWHGLPSDIAAYLRRTENSTKLLQKPKRSIDEECR